MRGREDVVASYSLPVNRLLLPFYYRQKDDFTNDASPREVTCSKHSCSLYIFARWPYLILRQGKLFEYGGIFLERLTDNYIL